MRRYIYSNNAYMYLILSRDEILKLREENTEIRKVLQLSSGGQNQDNDEQDVDRLVSLMEKMDEINRLCTNEEREIKDLDNQVSLMTYTRQQSCTDK